MRTMKTMKTGVRDFEGALRLALGSATGPPRASVPLPWQHARAKSRGGSRWRSSRASRPRRRTGLAQRLVAVPTRKRGSSGLISSSPNRDFLAPRLVRGRDHVFCGVLRLDARPVPRARSPRKGRLVDASLVARPRRSGALRADFKEHRAHRPVRRPRALFLVKQETTPWFIDAFCSSATRFLPRACPRSASRRARGVCARRRDERTGHFERRRSVCFSVCHQRRGARGTRDAGGLLARHQSSSPGRRARLQRPAVRVFVLDTGVVMDARRQDASSPSSLHNGTNCRRGRGTSSATEQALPRSSASERAARRARAFIRRRRVRSALHRACWAATGADASATCRRRVDARVLLQAKGSPQTRVLYVLVLALGLRPGTASETPRRRYYISKRARRLRRRRRRERHRPDPPATRSSARAPRRRLRTWGRATRRTSRMRTGRTSGRAAGRSPSSPRSRIASAHSVVRDDDTSNDDDDDAFYAEMSGSSMAAGVAAGAAAHFLGRHPDAPRRARRGRR